MQLSDRNLRLMKYFARAQEKLSLTPDVLSEVEEFKSA